MEIPVALQHSMGKAEQSVQLYCVVGLSGLHLVAIIHPCSLCMGWMPRASAACGAAEQVLAFLQPLHG